MEKSPGYKTMSEIGHTYTHVVCISTLHSRPLIHGACMHAVFVQQDNAQIELLQIFPLQRMSSRAICVNYSAHPMQKVE